jgi:hypothetical protein
MTKFAYNTKEFTWGFELEIGDVQRSLPIPKHLGSWEYAETDIINLFPPYQYVAADPKGVDPPVGGEINTIPTVSIESQLDLIGELLQWMRKKKQPPTVCCTTHSHIHVHVPGLKGDILSLKKLTKYIGENQAAAVAGCYPYADSAEMNLVPGCRAYFKYDGGRLMPQFMVDNILRYATDFDSFIRLQCCGKDARSMGRPFRYAINTYSLKHIDTIEFRCFRSSLDLMELRSCFNFVSEFLYAALNTGEPIANILKRGKYNFPKFRFSLAECQGWKKTRWDKSRGKKQRVYIPISSDN